MSIVNFSLLRSVAMAAIVSGLAAVAAPTEALAQPTGMPPPLITPAELKPLIDRKAVRVLDIRELFQGDGKTPNYAEGHIPSAVAAPYSSIRGPESNPGEMISDTELSSLISKWGINKETHVVIAPSGSDPSDFGGAARFYWTLKLAGIPKLSILEGGLGAWGALGYPLEKTAPVIAPSGIRVTLDKTQIVTTPQAIELVKLRDAGKRRLLLSDSRPEDYFTGADKHSSAARSGTMPGATNFDHEEWFQLNTGKLQPKAKLESIAKAAGLITDSEIVTFCNTGHWSATTWFVLSEILGRTNVKLYPESIIGWSKTRSRMDNEPARQKVLMNQLKEAVGNLKH